MELGAACRSHSGGRAYSLSVSANWRRANGQTANSPQRGRSLATFRKEDRGGTYVPFLGPSTAVAAHTTNEWSVLTSGAGQLGQSRSRTLVGSGGRKVACSLHDQCPQTTLVVSPCTFYYLENSSECHGGSIVNSRPPSLPVLVHPMIVTT